MHGRQPPQPAERRSPSRIPASHRGCCDKARLRIICVSYSIELAKKLANDFRAVVESDWYRRIFPGTRIGRFKNTETEIEFTERGYRLAVEPQQVVLGEAEAADWRIAF